VPTKAEALSLDQLSDPIAAFRDHPEFCRQSLTIRDKYGSTVPLVLTPAQRKLHRVIQEQEKRCQPVRIVCLKARQVHMSVGVASQMFRRLAFWPGQKGMVVGDSYKSARNLWDYQDQFDQSYKAYHGISKLITKRRVQPTQTSSGMLEWAKASMLETATARNLTAGRSYSVRHLNLSEYAFYGDAATLMTGLMQSVPKDAETSVIVDSTANGIGDPFHELCLMAQSGKTGWLFLFFGWHEHPEYVMPLAVSVREFQDSLTKEEIVLRRAHDLTFEQLNWRRSCIATDCQGDERRFHQEYPTTADEAFLTSGRPVFDQNSLTAIYSPEDPIVGELEEIDMGISRRLVFREQGGGALKIWRRPQPGQMYVIGGDPAQGIDVSAETGSTSDPDYSVANVFNQDTGEQVACLRERLVPSEFGPYTCALAKLYNMAYVVPEAIGIGIAYVESILRENYPMHLIYQRRRDPTDRRPPLLEEIGFKTTTTSRPNLISRLDGAIRERAITIHGMNTMQEHRAFVTRPDGRPEAQTKCHDDEVFSVALAIEGMQHAPRIRKMQERTVEQRLEPMQYRTKFGRPRQRGEDEDD